MKRDAVLIPPLHSSFLSCEKDVEIILNKLFKESMPYSNYLKRLLMINSKDCLDPNVSRYDDIVQSVSVKSLRDQHYIRTSPKLMFDEHEDLKSYILISFNNFTTNPVNEKFRDCIVTFDIVCHTDYWDLDDFKERPLMICGYIDGILNTQRLSGIGEFEFLNCNELILSNEICGYRLSYSAVHFTEDDKAFSELMN